MGFLSEQDDSFLPERTRLLGSRNSGFTPFMHLRPEDPVVHCCQQDALWRKRERERQSGKRRKPCSNGTKVGREELSREGSERREGTGSNRAKSG